MKTIDALVILAVIATMITCLAFLAKINIDIKPKEQFIDFNIKETHE